MPNNGADQMLFYRKAGNGRLVDGFLLQNLSYSERISRLFWLIWREVMITNFGSGTLSWATHIFPFFFLIPRFIKKLESCAY